MTAYATPEELRRDTNKQVDADDPTLADLLESASRVIDGVCNRPDGFLATVTATARIYAGSGKAYQWIDACVQITAVAVKDSPADAAYTAWTAADWLPFSGLPDDPEFNRLPYTGVMVAAGGSRSFFLSGRYSHLRGFRPDPDAQEFAVPTVQITARWGRSDTLNPIIKTATILQAARWFKRGQSSWADTLGTPETGQLMYRKVLDPDLELMLVKARLAVPAIGKR